MKKQTFMNFIKENKQILILFLFIPLRLTYVITQLSSLNYTEVHLSIDDYIPFVPFFIIFYFIWYVYVPSLLVYMCFKKSPDFKKQCIAFFAGAFVCALAFIIYPTSVSSIRPEVLTGNDIFTRLCGFIYSVDRPINACPSLHCYEAAAIHITTFSTDFMKKKKWLRIASAILAFLICASTVFVKQHSFLDVIIGVSIAVLSYLFVYKFKFSRDKALQ